MREGQRFSRRGWGESFSEVVGERLSSMEVPDDPQGDVAKMGKPIGPPTFPCYRARAFISPSYPSHPFPRQPAFSQAVRASYLCPGSRVPECGPLVPKLERTR